MSSLAKDASRSRISGGVFEYQLAGLAATRLRALRRHHPDLRFQVATNVDGANPFDDVVLHLSWLHNGHERKITYFVQLKHKEKVSVPVTTNDIVGKISKKNKDFNLHHYFKKFRDAVAKINSTPESKRTPTQVLLQRWFTDDFRLVLLTTRDVIPNKKGARDKPSLDFPFEQVLDTDQGEAFSFGQNDTDVWNMMSGQPEEISFREEFLPRLRVHGGQAMAFALRPLLARSFSHALFPDASVPTSHIDRLLVAYCDFLHSWWDSDDGVCLTEDSPEILRILQNDINNQLPPPVQFEADYYECFRNRLEDFDCVFVVVPGIPLEYRHSIAYSVVSNSTARTQSVCQVKRSSYVILTDSSFEDYSSQLLQELCEKLCNFVVLNLDNLKNIYPLVTNLPRSQKVILLTNIWDSYLYANLARSRVCSSWSELWAMKQLSEGMKRTLESQGVVFQGINLKWHEIQQEWPEIMSRIVGAVLGELLSGKPLIIGMPLQKLDSLYISRVLEHKTVISHAIFDLISDRDRFVLKGFPPERLESLRSYNSKWQECLPTGVVIERSLPSKSNKIFKKVHKHTNLKTLTKWTEWSDEIPTQPTSENENLHWLSMQGAFIVWEASEGNTECIQRFIEYKHKKCKIAAVCSHNDIQDLLDWKDSTVFIADKAGMGKSTFITYAAHYIKECRNLFWIIILRMSERRVINSLPENVELRHVLDIFKKVGLFKKGDGFDVGEKLLEDACLSSGKIIVMIDGVDEVCPAHKEKTFRMLSMIKRMLVLNGGKMWIAARTMLQEDIGITLKCPSPLKLCPFTRSEQQQYLVHRWKETKEDLSIEEISKPVVALLEAVSDVSGRESGLCDVPLYTKLLAETYEGENISFFLDRVTARRNFINRATLYKKFISKTLGSVWTKAGISENVRRNLDMLSDDIPLQVHKMCAALQCFNDSQLLGNHFESLLQEVRSLNEEKVKEKTAKFGLIVQVVDGNPEFLHLTIAEFLAASWLVDNCASLPALTKELYAGQFGEIRVFFDSLLAEGHQLHEAALSGTPGMINAALRSVNECGGRDAAVLEEDAGGRSALHLAAIYGHVPEARRLLAAGANPAARDRLHRWTPLHYADACVRFSSGDVWEPRQSSVSSHIGVVEALLKYGARTRHAPRVFKQKHLLRYAIQLDYKTIVKRVIQKQVMFCFLSRRNTSHMRDATKSRSLAVLEMLVDVGFSVNKVDEESGQTLLHIGAGKGFTDICELLLSAGADVNATDSLKNTPLHIAANGGNLTLCEVLLSFGADPLATNKYGSTPRRIWMSSEP